MGAEDGRLMPSLPRWNLSVGAVAFWLATFPLVGHAQDGGVTAGTASGGGASSRGSGSSLGGSGGPLVPPPPPSPPGVLRHARVVGDTTVQAMIMASPDEGDQARAAADEAFAEFARVMDSVRGPAGALEAINRQGAVAPVPVGPEALLLLQEALRVCQLSENALDPTGAIYDALWPFETPGFNQSPPAEELARRATLVDCRGVVVDGAGQTVALKRPGMRVGLHDLPRGLALDRAMTVLRGKGFGDAILFAGGDLVVSGHKAGKRWMVGVQDPRGAGHFAALPVAGGAVFTTADYEHSFMERGRRMHSILDPRTGLPARGVRSVTVLAPTGAEAAALSRAAFVLGPDKGMKFLERLPQVDAVMVDDRNRVTVTRRLEKVIKHRPPTDGP